MSEKKNPVLEGVVLERGYQPKPKSKAPLAPGEGYQPKSQNGHPAKQSSPPKKE